MRWWNNKTMWFIALFFFLSTGLPSQEATAGIFGDDKEPRVIVVFVDMSGSTNKARRTVYKNAFNMIYKTLDQGDRISGYVTRMATILHAAIARFNRMDPPVVMAINGTAAGAGGMEIVPGTVIAAVGVRAAMQRHSRAVSGRRSPARDADYSRLMTSEAS